MSLLASITNCWPKSRPEDSPKSGKGRKRKIGKGARFFFLRLGACSQGTARYCTRLHDHQDHDHDHIWVRTPKSRGRVSTNQTFRREFRKERVRFFSRSSSCKDGRVSLTISGVFVQLFPGGYLFSYNLVKICSQSQYFDHF